MAIYSKPGHQLLYSPMTDEMKCPIGYTFALRIPFHLLQCRCNTCTNTINNDMIHFISSHDHIGSSILTLLALHHCHRPSAPSLTQASPPRDPSLQSLRLALHACNWSIKPSLVLIFSTLITWLNVMSHVHLSSFIITCVSFAIFPSHFHLHGICCSHTCICGLITCVSHINTISPPRLSLNYQNHTRTFHASVPLWNWATINCPISRRLGLAKRHLVLCPFLMDVQLDIDGF